METKQELMSIREWLGREWVKGIKNNPKYKDNKERQIIIEQTINKLVRVIDRIK